MQRSISFVLTLVFASLVLAAMTIFTVDQRQFAIIFQLGEVKSVISQPGLVFKWPMIQNVRFFDKRILTLDSAEPERFLTAEKKPVLVDSFVKWRIHNVKQYYISVGGDEAVARTRLMQTVNSGLREEFGRRTVHDVVSGKRDSIMVEVQKKADADMRAIGVEIVDVRLKRVDFPPEVSESV
jgi:membrane protease subunit HflC